MTTSETLCVLGGRAGSVLAEHTCRACHGRGVFCRAIPRCDGGQAPLITWRGIPPV